jgi:hypothetical protein
MRYLQPFRLATYLLVLFFGGHTIGGMLGQKSQGSEAGAVFASMKSVHFVFNGASCSWYDFWFGFGLMVSVFLLFCAAMSWRLASVDPHDWPVAAPFAWLLAISMIANAILSARYFFAGPAITSTLVVLLMLWGIAAKKRALVGRAQDLITG